MRSKKLISLLCASALSVSAFAGMVITSSAAETVLWSDTFEGYTNNVEPHGNLSALNSMVLVDGTLTANNQCKLIDGVILQTANRQDDSSFFMLSEGEESNSKALMATTARFATESRGAEIQFTEVGSDADPVPAKTYAPESGKDLVLASRFKLTDTKVTTYGHVLCFNGTAISVNLTEAGVSLDEWHDLKVVINASSGAVVYVDGEQIATLAGLKNLSTLKFDRALGAGNEQKASDLGGNQCLDYPRWHFDDMVIYSSDNGAASTPPAALTHPPKGVTYEVVPQGVISEKIEKMDVNEIASNDFNTRATTDTNGRYIFTGGSDTGIFDELDIVTLKAGTGGDARGESNWKPVGNTNTDPTLGTDTFLQANMGQGSGAGNGPQMVFKGYGTVDEETGARELAEREGVSVSFAARLTKGETAPAEMIFSGSLDVSGSTYNLIYPQAMITTDAEADSSVYAVDHPLTKVADGGTNILQVNSGEWFLVTMDTYRAEGKTATATINVTTYPKDGDPVVTEIFNGNVASSTGNGINQLMSISFRAGNSDKWGVSNSKVDFDNMVMGSTNAAPVETVAPTEAPTPTPAPTLIPAVEGIEITEPVEVGAEAVALTGTDGKTAKVIHASYDADGTLTAVSLLDAAASVTLKRPVAEGDMIAVWNDVSNLGLQPVDVVKIARAAAPAESTNPAPEATDAPAASTAPDAPAE